jgi:hypothetical protein
MSGAAEASEVLIRYLIDLASNYSRLIKILELEHTDIENSDESALFEHTKLESQTAGVIVTLTKTIYSYLEIIKPDKQSAEHLAAAGCLKDKAASLSKENILLLDGELLRLKTRLSANKLPITARRVYYAGETPTIMDIKI